MKFLSTYFLLLCAVLSSHGADPVRVTEFNLSSRLLIPKFALPTHFPGCRELTLALARDTASDVEAIRWHSAESAMMNNRKLRVRPFVSLNGKTSAAYYPPMWDWLSGSIPNDSEIPKRVRDVVELAFYAGLDGLGDPVAVLRAGNVMTKELGVYPDQPDVMLNISPEWQFRDYWVLDDIHLDPSIQEDGFVNEQIMFLGLIQTVILPTPSQKNTYKIIAFSGDPRRSEALMAMGFELASMPSNGILYIQRGGKRQRLDFAKERSKGTKMFQYFIDRTEGSDFR